MKDQGIDVLVCRLPENVVYLTEYWPHHGVSVALLFQTGAPQLHAPEVEAEWAVPGWADVHPFGWSLLKDPDVYATYRDILGECAADLHPGNAVVAVEQTAEVVGPSYRSAEPIVPAAPWHAMLAEVFAKATLVDATPILSEARGIKSPYEIEKLRTTAEVAEAAIKYAISKIEPGMSEAHIGALVEFHARSEGPGRNGARLVRCSAEVAAGLNTTKAVLLIPSTEYAVREGDLVMIEVGTVVDGYWSDLTYMAVVGEPTDRQREVHNALLKAQHAAMAALVPGNPQSLPDQIAREELDRAGLGQYYPHITGHGIGLRYHEWVPMLMPGASGLLAAGMYTAVEPGVYIPGFGGIRIEDNVVVGETGPMPLSTPRFPW